MIYAFSDGKVSYIYRLAGNGSLILRPLLQQGRIVISPNNRVSSSILIILAGPLSVMITILNPEMMEFKAYSDASYEKPHTTDGAARSAGHLQSAVETNKLSINTAKMVSDELA